MLNIFRFFSETAASLYQDESTEERQDMLIDWGSTLRVNTTGIK
jgi:hypothetical protein